MQAGRLPLYRFEGELPKLIGDGHLGLWFDKFFDRWVRTEEVRKQSRHLPSEKESKTRGWSIQATHTENPKIDWFQKLLGDGALAGREDLISESVGRYLRMVEAHGGRWRVFRTESRFVTGLGRRHPVENGFAWHPTMGVPYLPGSSVKGMVRAWVERIYSGSVDADVLTRLFGPNLKDRSRGVESRKGAVAFLDAIPCRPPGLAVDVMTPHYANWSPQDPPGDWRSPTPIPFLTTETRAQFLFGLLPSGEVSDSELDRVMEWLAEALDWAGAGAKTAVGYGRMRPDEAEERLLRQRMRQ